MGEDDYSAAWKSLLDGPGLVWTTANDGYWIGGRGDVVRNLWNDSERLSNNCLAVTPGLGDVLQFIPLQQEAAEHKAFRMTVMKGLASRHVVALEPRVVEIPGELIASLLSRRLCDFVANFAEVLPLNIFSVVD